MVWYYIVLWYYSNRYGIRVGEWLAKRRIYVRRWTGFEGLVEAVKGDRDADFWALEKYIDIPRNTDETSLETFFTMKKNCIGGPRTNW